MGKKLFNLLAISLFCYSCIGKIEDKNPEKTKGAQAVSKPLDFIGISDARAISNDKIEVYFYPAEVEDQSKISYHVSYDGIPIVTSFSGETLQKDYRGMFRVVLDKLEMNTNYKLSVQISNKETKEESSVKTNIEVKTFQNLTADFYGLSNLRNLPGVEGKNSIYVDWPGATKLGIGPLENEIDPIQYVITAINSDVLKPDSFDDEDFSGTDRKVFYAVGDTVFTRLNGLKAGTKYYVRVRAIHSGFSDFSTDPTYLTEQNNKYLEITTLDDDLASIVIDSDSLQIRADLGSVGLTTLAMNWKLKEAAFDHYRVYYKKNGEGLEWASQKSSLPIDCNGAILSTAYSCQKISYKENSFKLTDLAPYTKYDVYLVICQTEDCSSGRRKEFESKGPYTTDPGFVRFSGIKKINSPSNYWALDEISLEFENPDLSTGALDGIIVKLHARSDTGGNFKYLNHPDESLLETSSPFYKNDTGLIVSTFRFDTASSKIKISGIDNDSPENYCFSLLPYIFKNEGYEINNSNEVILCKSIRVETPKVTEFIGFETVSRSLTSGNNEISMTWRPPSAGVYSHYHVFLYKSENSSDLNFNFSDAINNPGTKYMKVSIPYGTTSYTFSFVPSGTYQVGILTYLESSDEYSSFNADVRKVEIP